MWNLNLKLTSSNVLFANSQFAVTEQLQTLNLTVCLAGEMLPVCLGGLASEVLFYIQIFLKEKEGEGKEEEEESVRDQEGKEESSSSSVDVVAPVWEYWCGCCGLTGWQWAEQLMLLVRSRWKPLAGSRLRLHCLLWHKPSSSCSTSVWPGRNTPRSPNTHTASRTEHTHTHRGQMLQCTTMPILHFSDGFQKLIMFHYNIFHLVFSFSLLSWSLSCVFFLFNYESIYMCLERLIKFIQSLLDCCYERKVCFPMLNLKQRPSPAALTTLVSFAGTLVLWVVQGGPVQLGRLSLQNTTRTGPGSGHI